MEDSGGATPSGSQKLDEKIIMKGISESGKGGSGGFWLEMLWTLNQWSPRVKPAENTNQDFSVNTSRFRFDVFCTFSVANIHFLATFSVSRSQRFLHVSCRERFLHVFCLTFSERFLTIYMATFSERFIRFLFLFPTFSVGH